jgi:hypothetical protein
MDRAEIEDALMIAENEGDKDAAAKLRALLQIE